MSPLLIGVVIQSGARPITFHVYTRVDVADGIQSVDRVSKEGCLIGQSGQLGLHDGHTEPLFIRHGKVVKNAPKFGTAPKPSCRKIEIPKDLIKSFPLTDGVGDDFGGIYEVYGYPLRNGFELWQITTAFGMEYSYQLGMKDSLGNVHPLGEFIYGYKKYTIVSVEALEKGWAMFTCSYNPDHPNKYLRPGRLGQIAIWATWK
ncbi:MAG: hypothetical protein JST40_06920 [Armatimonadetes bacterium]|nr:hypothetical protein [Armatimonadota bacterium]